MATGFVDEAQAVRPNAALSTISRDFTGDLLDLDDGFLTQPLVVLGHLGVLPGNVLGLLKTALQALGQGRLVLQLSGVVPAMPHHMVGSGQGHDDAQRTKGVFGDGGQEDGGDHASFHSGRR